MNSRPSCSSTVTVRRSAPTTWRLVSDPAVGVVDDARADAGLRHRERIGRVAGRTVIVTTAGLTALGGAGDRRLVVDDRLSASSSRDAAPESARRRRRSRRSAHAAGDQRHARSSADETCRRAGRPRRWPPTRTSWRRRRCVGVGARSWPGSGSSQCCGVCCCHGWAPATATALLGRAVRAGSAVRDACVGITGSRSGVRWVVGLGVWVDLILDRAVLSYWNYSRQPQGCHDPGSGADSGR